MKLKVGVKIDFRVSNNKFIPCEIINETDDNLQPMRGINIDNEGISEDELQFKKNDGLKFIA